MTALEKGKRWASGMGALVRTQPQNGRFALGLRVWLNGRKMPMDHPRLRLGKPSRDAKNPYSDWESDKICAELVDILYSVGTRREAKPKNTAMGVKPKNTDRRGKPKNPAGRGKKVTL